ncbi:hypothetical protein [Thioalkalivibrio sp. ALgr3]|uniref:hypothetical protein n=1 Tax=Thioalkalivibrio sp. ALgr3 TaxID=1239292 RepID=UPI00036D95B3|nr:hypothetical protein [Thioalkalivibrio sp. ALgr3]
MGRTESNARPSVELYLASTPLQVLNAVEARHALGDANARAVLILFQRRWEHHAAAATLPDPMIAAFDEVLPLHLELPASDGKPWTAVTAMARNRRAVLDTLARFSNIFIARVVVTNQWNRDMRYLAAKAGAEIVFADDGTSTASYLKACAEWGAAADWRLGFANRGRLVNLAAASLYRLVYGGFMPKSRPDLMFTHYRALAEEAGFPVVDNQYRWLRSTFGAGQTDTDTTAHFLGAPLVERGEVSEGEYFAWLREAVDLAPELKWTYVPHPAESDRWLERLGRETGVSWKRMQAPYELSLLMEDSPPAVIASWFSSALENLEMFGVCSELWAFRIPDGSLASDTLARSARDFYNRQGQAKGKIRVHELRDWA